MNLTSTEASTRVGNAINRHHKRVTSLLGMEQTRFTTLSVNTSGGTRTVTAQELEKVDRVIDATTATSIIVLEEVSLDYIRTFQTASGRPTKWAVQSIDTDAVVIVFDMTPDATYAMKIDGTAPAATLSGSNEPLIPESYHDILTWSVCAEEFARKDKLDLAQYYELKAKELLQQLQFQFAESYSMDSRQNMRAGRRGRFARVGVWNNG